MTKEKAHSVIFPPHPLRLTHMCRWRTHSMSGRLGSKEGWVNKAFLICWWSLDAEVGSLALRHVISLSSLSLFPAGLHCKTHTHTHTRTLTHTLSRSASLTQTLYLVRWREDWGSHYQLSFSMGGRSQEQTEQSFHWSLPPHAWEGADKWRGGKLAPCHHNVGLLLTGDRHRLKEEEDRRCCMHVADTAVTWSACHQLRCWSVCDTGCFWWLCCPRISKKSWTENIAEVKKERYSPFFCRVWLICYWNLVRDSLASNYGWI